MRSQLGRRVSKCRGAGRWNPCGWLSYIGMTRRELMSTALAAAAPLAGQAKRPNILFAIADDWGWPHAGAYGCGWVKTPAFDRIAAEGVLFANCFTSNPKCSPCRASILAWAIEPAMSCR